MGLPNFRTVVRDLGRRVGVDSSRSELVVGHEDGLVRAQDLAVGFASHQEQGSERFSKQSVVDWNSMRRQLEWRV